MQGRIRPATSYLALALVALVSVALTARAEAQTSIVANGDFESPVVSGAFGNLTWPGFDSWGVEPSAPDGDWASIDLVRDLWPAASGAQSVDLNGSYGDGASLTQTLTTQIGVTYTLSFAFAGNPDPSEACATSPVVKSMALLWGETRAGVFTFDTTDRSLADPGWQTISVPVTATTATTTLRFDSLVYGACGPALDAVAVTPAGFRPGKGCGDRKHVHARAADCKRQAGSSSTLGMSATPGARSPGSSSATASYRTPTGGSSCWTPTSGSRRSGCDGRPTFTAMSRALFTASSYVALELVIQHD